MGGKSNKRADGYVMNDSDRFYDYQGEREEIRATHSMMLKRHQLRSKRKKKF